MARMNMKSFSKFALLAIVAPISLSGCISLLPKPGKPALIAPFAASPNVELRQNIGKSIIIDIPKLPDAMTKNDIMVRTADGALAYIDGVNLVASTPKAIQGLIIETFDRAGAFKLVGRDSTSVNADYFLALDVAKFELNEPSWRKAGLAKVTISARLIKYSDRSALANKMFEITSDAKKGSPLEPAAALEKATQIAASNILDWVIEFDKAHQISSAASANK